MILAVTPPVSPMLAKAATVLPDGDGWWFEPKWDGFRCIIFRDGDHIELGSRNEKPLTRYFPEVVAAARASLPDRCVIDGEIVLPSLNGHGLDFDALLQRIHPAESRVNKLALETPASFVAFDLLALGSRSLLAQPLSERVQTLASVMSGARPPVYLTPGTTDRTVAEQWFATFEGAGLDGVVAKPLDSHYTQGKRTLIKVKHRRTADCVVGGYRIHTSSDGVGSLLLGLFDDSGALHHVGVTASFTVAKRRELAALLAPLDCAPEGHPWGDVIGADRHRWNAKKDLTWQPIAPTLVCEVAFDQLQGQRFRHGTTFLNWRPDRTPESCRFDQLEVAAPMDFKDFVGSRKPV